MWSLWSLPALDEVDLVATGVTVLDERRVEGVTFSDSYLQVRRGLRIHADEFDRFETIHDFVGSKVGAVEGMTSLSDLLRRAPDGVDVVVYSSWDDMYMDFYNKQVNAVAEGFYVSVDARINHADPDFPMVDDHDLISGEPEVLSFAVRDASEGLLEAINDLLGKTGFPVKSVWDINGISD